MKLIIITPELEKKVAIMQKEFMELFQSGSLQAVQLGADLTAICSNLAIVCRKIADTPSETINFDSAFIGVIKIYLEGNLAAFKREIEIMEKASHLLEQELSTFQEGECCEN